jgi:hypothetical protein
MGFGCPDNVAPGAPACDPAYGSFSTQLYQAARHFRGYMNNTPGWYIPFNTGWNSVAWNPSVSCGAGDVYIENRSTVALYSYTGYQPNQAAKNAQYGLGDGCSAYGNRNFYLYFSDWFGSVYGDAQVISPLTLLSPAPEGLFTNGFVEASFIIKNNSAQSRDIGYISIAVRDSAGGNYDFGTQHIVLAPYQEYLYRAATNLTKEDKYSFWITSYHDDRWDDNYPSSIRNYTRRYDNKLVQKMPTLTVDPQADSELRVGKTSNISFTAVNNSAYPINLGYVAAGIRSPSGQNADLPLSDATNIAPNTTYTYTKPFVPKEEGDYKATVLSTLDNGSSWNNASYPVPVGGDGRSTLNVKSNPTLTEGPKLNIAAPRVGQNTTFTFKVKNYSEKAVDGGYVGLVVRDPDNGNVDVGGVSLGNLTPNSEYIYTGSRAFTKPGTYTAWIVSYKNGGWNDNLPTSDSGVVQRKITFTVKPSPTLTQGLTISNAYPSAGESVTGTFKVKNFSDTTVSVNKSLCYILRGNNKNYDLGCLDIKTLAAGEEKIFTASRVVGEAGEYRAYFSMFDGSWHDNWSFDQETGTEPKSLSFKVKSNPTLTQGLTITNLNPHEGDSIVGTFKVTNNSTAPVAVNKSLCYIVRSASNKNYDFGCLDIATLQSGQEVVYTGTRELPSGTYRASFSMFDGSWHDNWSFDQETGTEPKTLNFTVKSSPVLTQGLTLSAANPKVGDAVVGSFKVKNLSAKSVTVNKALCYVVRDAQSKNQDFGCVEIGIINPGQELVFSSSKVLKSAGNYRAYFSMFDGSWHDNWSFDQETGTEPKTLNFTVAP